jgi:hypothetical protein
MDARGYSMKQQLQSVREQHTGKMSQCTTVS